MKTNANVDPRTITSCPSCMGLTTMKNYLNYLNTEEGKMKIERVCTKEQAADLLTKGNHGRMEWNRLLNTVGMVNDGGSALRKGA